MIIGKETVYVGPADGLRPGSIAFVPILQRWFLAASDGHGEDVLIEMNGGEPCSMIDRDAAGDASALVLREWRLELIEPFNEGRHFQPRKGAAFLSANSSGLVVAYAGARPGQGVRAVSESGLLSSVITRENMIVTPDWRIVTGSTDAPIAVCGPAVPGTGSS